jgi:enterochelin esterase-like enzyme
MFRLGMIEVPSVPGGSRGPIARRALIAVAAAAFLSVGLLGAARYVDNYWLYRGFAPPHDPAYVSQPGTSLTITVASRALGGRRQQVDVYLPPGYAQHPTRRYPVFYLLHGTPGLPSAFLQTVKLGVDEDALLALGRMKPVILVMPHGSPGVFADTEWANGVAAHSAWETFLARDVVHAIDARFRTIRSGSARALGGLSEGGYGALNIGLHFPGEFGILESWSGYERAYDIPSIFGTGPARMRYNSPLLVLPHVAPALRKAHTFVWFYTDTGDRPRIQAQNEQFAAALARAHIGHRFFVVQGGHTWRIWRGLGERALRVAASHLHG